MKSKWIFKTKGQKPLTKTTGDKKMFVNDNLDYQLDQMRWEYECAMWEQAQIKNKECDKEQAKRTKRLKRMIEKAINKTKGIQ